MNAITKKITLLVVLLCTMFSGAKLAQAQIVYESESLSINGAPKHTYLGMTIDKFLGLYWTCKQGNFFQLDISPAAPRIAGHLDRIVFYNSATSTFNSIEVANVYTHSDERAKEQITPISGALNVIQALNPVSFRWKNDFTTRKLPSTNTAVNESSLETERIQLGFIAQEVEKILPDAVLTDEEGHKLINYNAIIPLLVRSVQELKEQIRKQQDLIDGLSKGESLRYYHSLEKDQLLDCIPNPSNGVVEVTYILNEGYEEAYILVSDLSGNKEAEIQALSPIQRKVEADLSALNRGIHLITLVVNGRATNSLQLVLN